MKSAWLNTASSESLKPKRIYFTPAEEMSKTLLNTFAHHRLTGFTLVAV